jgi:hypothetical protein
MNGQFVCLDCITQATKPRLLNRRVLAVAALAAVVVGAAMYFALPSRQSPAPTIPADDRVASLSTPEQDGDDSALPATDEPAPSRPERSADKLPTRSDDPDEPLSLPPSITARPEPRDEKPAPAASPVARRKTAGEPELIQDLAAAPEVGLGGTGPAVFTSYVSSIKEHLQRQGSPRLADPTPMIRTRPDLRDLPLRTGAACQLNAREGENLGILSRKLHVYLDVTASPDGIPRSETTADLLRQALVSDKRGQRPEWFRPEAVPTLLQMLMPEDAPVRKLLVDILAEIPHTSTTTALAQRAVFDLDAEVRRAAVKALRKRPAEVYRPILLKALRYPWAPAADHAAAALVQLGDRSVVPHLVAMLRQPDPTLPEQLPNGLRVVREVVRVQHTANCLLCHPPSFDGGPVLGPDPVLRIPVVGPRTVLNAMTQSSTQMSQSGAAQAPPSPPASGGYGAGTSPVSGGNSPGATTSTTIRATGSRSTPVQVVRTNVRPSTQLARTDIPVLIRADITFFRQDFSVKIPTSKLTPLPELLRFDFMIRTRKLTPTEASHLTEKCKDQTTYPQREAVLFALRELTGKDAGQTTAAWRDLFPRAEIDVEASRALRELRAGDAVNRAVLLAGWRQGCGELLTSALATLIPDLDADLQAKVREVLIDRLTHLDAQALRPRLGDDDPELRRAAVLACGRKKDKSLVPDLITLLDDAEPADAALIEESLHSLTGEQQDGAAAWRAWWEKNATE